MADKKQPTEEQLEALRSFKAKWGVQWKAELSSQWARGGEGGGYMSRPDGHLLHQLRNSFGPTWLYKQKLV